MTPQQQREENRKSMPKVAEFVDAMRKAFGRDQVVVIYAKENGREIRAK